MGLFDRVKKILEPEMGDPNPIITGTPARGRIVNSGRYSAGGDAGEVRWSKKEVTLYVVGGPEDQQTKVSFFANTRAHDRASEGVEVPILLDPHGAVLGVDVATWEAEVAAHPAPDAGPQIDPDATTWEQDAGALDSVEGVDFDTWVAVEAALATEAVPPADHDARAQQLGVPAGRWSSVQTEWQGRLRKDWKLASRFGAAYGAATGQS